MCSSHCEQLPRVEQTLVLQVYLWDQRGGSAPRTKLGMGSGFSMNSLQLSEDENVLLVGTQTADVSLPHFFAFLANLHTCQEIAPGGCWVSGAMTR